MRATRRDFFDIVKVVRRLEKGTTKRLMWGHALGDILERSNPRFQKRAFIDACGMDDVDELKVVDLKQKLLEK